MKLGRKETIPVSLSPDSVREPKGPAKEFAKFHVSSSIPVAPIRARSGPLASVKVIVPPPARSLASGLLPFSRMIRTFQPTPFSP
jgi:hypothetical protein